LLYDANVERFVLQRDAQEYDEMLNSIITLDQITTSINLKVSFRQKLWE